ncbi:MAG TPA: tryptophan--tRNA ligase [Candidatus Saccharibacteria bacterium]|jgi:tryptophanyl-tRNA synthetase|nr:tryptophan--tRNA ligase [Candidatus Saccharibacteria bacterium]HMT55368.1 tryptophan--tRNA ligase [Candidatus Saccharibacteria bacterium]
MSKKVILTGLRTNAGYHLGNYLGAILPMVRLQQEHLGEYQINMFAPDLHSFTTEIEYGKLYQQTMENLKVFVAAGMPIDHPDFYLYRQSYIPAHSELTVILNNFAYFGELSRMTQFKDKGGRSSLKNKVLELKKLGEELASVPDEFGPDWQEYENELYDLLEHTLGVQKSVTLGLFDYPVLMAADILLYGASYVPVGDDQRQHLELTRDIAIRMNNKFKDRGLEFVVPKDWNKQLVFSHRLEGARIRSLRNPEKKMSKSVEDPSGTILLTDSPEEAEKKVMRAETDALGSIQWDWDKQPGITNLLQIYELLSGKTHDDVLGEWENKERYGDLKKVVAEHVSVFLHEFQMNLANVDESELKKKLEESEKLMTETAQQTLRKVQKAVGLRP